MDISLNKYISDTGYCSRREADRLIETGRVMLNNEVAVTGNRYRPGDEVVVDGSIVNPAGKEKRVMLAFNKPPGITTTTDTDIRDNIISYINYPKRIFPIGRLDKDSEGLIFLTNDGDIVNKILRAGNQHEKEYSVRVDRNIDGLFMKSMSEGVRIDGTKTLPCRVRQTGKHAFSIILVQGLNRQIRKMCEVLGFKVTFLQRVRVMHVKLDKLPLGKWRYLSEPEMEALHHSVEYSASVAAPRVKASSKKSAFDRNRPGKTELGKPEEQGKRKPWESAERGAGQKAAKGGAKHGARPNADDSAAGKEGARPNAGNSTAGKKAAKGGAKHGARPNADNSTAGKKAAKGGAKHGARPNADNSTAGKKAASPNADRDTDAKRETWQKPDKAPNRPFKKGADQKPEKDNQAWSQKPEKGQQAMGKKPQKGQQDMSQKPGFKKDAGRSREQSEKGKKKSSTYSDFRKKGGKR